MHAYAQVGSSILWSSEPKPREWCHTLRVTLPISISLKIIILHGLGQRVINLLQVFMETCLLVMLGLAKLTMLSSIEAHRYTEYFGGDSSSEPSTVVKYTSSWFFRFHLKELP